LVGAAGERVGGDAVGARLGAMAGRLQGLKPV